MSVRCGHAADVPARFGKRGVPPAWRGGAARTATTFAANEVELGARPELTC